MKSNKFLYLSLLFLILISPDPLLMAYTAGVFIIIIKYMWRINETKHLFVSLIMYWLVVSLLLPYGSIFSIPLADLSYYGNSETLPLANFLGVTSLVFFILGIQIPVSKIKILDLKNLSHELSYYDSRKIIFTYIIFSVSSNVFLKLLLTASAGQLFFAFLNFKWVMLTFLVVHSLLFPSNIKYVIIIVSIEIILSFSGFWSSFKDYIIILLGAFFLLNKRISFKNIIYISITLSILYVFLVIWTKSKGEYRFYLTGGERTQAVVQNNSLENIGIFYSIVKKDFNSNNFLESFKQGNISLLYRISYIEYFSMALKQVPTMIPYENGKLTKEAIMHVLQPRIFFPDKKAIDDSEITSKYTGISFSGREQGASFSLGMVPECYIDFGPFYMFLPIFIYGICMGLMYSYFMKKARNIIWGLCYSAPMYNFLPAFGIPSTKFFGWSITYFLGIWFINKYLVKHLNKWMIKREYK
jgi:hypothetical protein